MFYSHIRTNIILFVVFQTTLEAQKQTDNYLESPTLNNTAIPSPTLAPFVTASPSPTLAPFVTPSPSPTLAPFVTPSPSPTLAPYVIPSPSPTLAPFVIPSPSPTLAPFVIPSSPCPSKSSYVIPSPSPIPITAPGVIPSLAPGVLPDNYASQYQHRNPHPQKQNNNSQIKGASTNHGKQYNGDDWQSEALVSNVANTQGKQASLNSQSNENVATKGNPQPGATTANGNDDSKTDSTGTNNTKAQAPGNVPTVSPPASESSYSSGNSNNASSNVVNDSKSDPDSSSLNRDQQSYNPPPVNYNPAGELEDEEDEDLQSGTTTNDAMDSNDSNVSSSVNYPPPATNPSVIGVNDSKSGPDSISTVSDQQNQSQGSLNSYPVDEVPKGDTQPGATTNNGNDGASPVTASPLDSQSSNSKGGLDNVPTNANKDSSKSPTNQDPKSASQNNPPNQGNSKQSGSTNFPINFGEFRDAVKVMGPQPSENVYKGFISGAEKEGILDKTELAMFLAQIMWESNGLKYKEEIGCSNGSCKTRYGGQPGDALSYHGRGYMQLSWKYNYEAASQALFQNDCLVRDPDLVKNDESISWQTSFWYWKERVHTKPGVSEGKFGVTTMAINGGECTGMFPVENARERFSNYKKIFAILKLPGAPIESGCY